MGGQFVSLLNESLPISRFLCNNSEIAVYISSDSILSIGIDFLIET